MPAARRPVEDRAVAVGIQLSAVSCSEILRYLCSLRNGYDAVVPTNADGYEPLFALYAKSCLGPIRALLDSGDFCAYAYYPQVRVRYVAYEELARFDRDGRAFLNVNTPEEFAKTGDAP